MVSSNIGINKEKKMTGKMKKNQALLASFLLVTSVAFAKTTTSNKSDKTEKVEKAENAKKDNSAVNVRDEKALTADEQGYGSERDVEITRKIRQEIMKHKELSSYAHNVKIVTLGGKVFLRGPVKSAEEKASVKAHADKIAGAENVKDELEIVTK
jgi:hyperosmotically inducible protein